MEQNKVYEINGAEFVLKNKYTLKESREIKKLCGNVIVQGTTITGNFNDEETFEKFLQMVLVRKDGKPVNDSFDFGETDDETAFSVFTDFFLERGMKMINLLASLEN